MCDCEEISGVSWGVCGGNDLGSPGRIIHGEVACLFGIFPFEINAGKFSAFPISGDGVVWLEGFAQVVDMAIFDVFYTKIVNNEDEDYGAPFVAPHARVGGGLVVTWCFEASSEEIAGNHSSLG